jgi:hypothetical protein
MKGNKNMKKRTVGLFLMVTILITLVVFPAVKAKAAYDEMYSGTFIEQLVKKLKLEVVPSSDTDEYLEAAIKAGVVKEEERKVFYFSTISRDYAAVFINRADEYLHGDTVDPELVKKIQDKRISDINKVPKNMREGVAKCFAKGIVIGYSNGYYIQNRKFKGDDILTTSDAKIMFTRLLNTKSRAKVSPDGLLIRTTNLPKNAKNYEYILACYPNSFYERKFEFMFTEQYKAGERNPEYEIYPVQMKNSTFKTWNDSWAFFIEMDKYLYDWQKKAETYLNYVFNVNYKTVDNEWINGLASCYVKSNINEADSIKDYYLKHIKANRVIVESSIIAVEPSSLYYDGDYCMRAYVKYRITAKNINVKQNRLLWCQYPMLDNLKSGEWRSIIVDIRFGSNNGYQGDGDYWAINPLTNFIDEYNSVK